MSSVKRKIEGAYASVCCVHLLFLSPLFCSFPLFPSLPPSSATALQAEVEEVCEGEGETYDQALKRSQEEIDQQNE